MPRLILLAIVAFVLWYGWRYLKAQNSRERRRLLWKWGSLVLVVVAVGLVATGRIHWVGAALAALVPLLRTALHWAPRLIPVASILGRKFGPSTLRTQGLHVIFDFSSGDANGEIFTGPYAGEKLEQLSKEQLKEQLAFFQANDRQSALLLQAYLVRRGIGGFSQTGQQTASADTDVSVDEAWQILGLDPGADKEAINKAHKRLIQKLHPDRGGNQYLAAKINAARDRLLS